VAWTDRARLRLTTDHQHEWVERISSMATVPDMQRIKREVTILRVLEHYSVLPLEASGNGLSGPCPLHRSSKSSRAFRVSADGHAWYCFGACQRGGSVIDLVARFEGCSIKEAAALLADRFAIA
jgi:DNA primase